MMEKYLLKHSKNEQGIVLVTVIFMVIALMILAVTMMSVNSSQAVSSQHQIERIKAEQLAKGAFWFNYMHRINHPEYTGTPPLNGTEIMDGKIYTFNIIPGSVDTNYNDTTPFNAQVTYQKTF